MSPRRHLAPVPVLLAAALLLSGCMSEDDSSPAASTGSAASDTAADADTGEDPGGGTGGSDDGSAPSGEDGGDAPPFPSDTSPDEQAASGDALVTVTDIRTGRHDGFDRVVLEVEGAGTPGWDVRYVDAASSQGSGDPVEVAGDAVLQVTVTGAGYPYDTGAEEYAGADPLPGEGTQTVTEVAFDATYEGTTVAFIGTSSQAPFRVYLLEDPSRLVVEVADQA